MAQLERDAREIARRFGLRYAALEPERAGVRRRYGVCYADGRIKIRLRHAVTGEPLRYSSLVNTLCHELAHLRHFNHGERFRIFYRQVLEYARSCGIYRPRGPERGADPLHLPEARRAVPVLLARTAPTLARAPGPMRGTRRRAAPVQLALFADPSTTR
jgi:hypothetical protein